MSLSNLFKNSGRVLKKHSPEILTGLSIAGVVTTSYLVGKAAYAARKHMDYIEHIEGVSDDPKIRLKETVEETWHLYIPAGVSGLVTVGCIIGASRAGSRKTAAAAAAYSITERAFSEYKDKVVEELGRGKEEKLRDSIAQDIMDANPASTTEVYVVGMGNVLCCELLTRRYFKSDMESLRKAQNDINAQIVNELYVPLSDFYDIIGLGRTSNSSEMGWDSEKLMELKFTTTLSDSGEPCLAFDYNYLKPI